MSSRNPFTERRPLQQAWLSNGIHSRSRRLRMEQLEVRRMLALAPEMIRDFNSHDLGSFPEQLATLGNLVYFSADDGKVGRELWRTDGTAAGTMLVKDINPGASNAHPGLFTDLNGTLYFTAGDESSGSELWKSDGTEAGTVLVKDIREGVSGSAPQNLIAIGGELYFTADDGISGVELWKTDGSQGGTVLVRDIFTGTNGSNPRYLTGFGGMLYFVADDGATGFELWKSDGTEAGTVQVKDIFAGIESSTPRQLARLGNELYFAANDGLSGVELWKTDGSDSGTTLVKDIWTGRTDGLLNGSYPGDLTELNGTLFFSAFDGVFGRELWKSDGSSTGTVRVKDIRTGGASQYGPNSSFPQALTNFGGTLYFAANDGNSFFELWKSDGTEAGTVQVSEIGGKDTGLNPHSIYTTQDTMYLLTPHGRGLWKSDGTRAGTVQLTTALNSYHDTPVVLAGTVFFAGRSSTHGVELWKSDGTTAGTMQVKNIRETGTYGSNPADFTNHQGSLFFSSSSGLWKTDGTNGGTALISPREAGNLISVGNHLFFTSESDSRTSLWRTDGTAAGTNKVRDLPGNTENFATINEMLYFGLYEPLTGRELWQSDGTANGTVMLKDIRPGSQGSYPSGLTSIDGVLYFSANDGKVGHELWKSDGTSQGTILIKDIHLGRNQYGPLGSDPRLFQRVGEMLFFTAFDEASGWELWRTDGTAKGTYLVKDVSPGAAGSYISNLTELNGVLYFTAANETGTALWRSDGSAAGTLKVRDGNAYSLIAAHDFLWFGGEPDESGNGLWRSDGTATGTIKVSTTPTSPVQLTPVGSSLYFLVRTQGRFAPSNVWISDGTETGTKKVSDVGVPWSFYPEQKLFASHGSLFFVADDGIHGRELWVIRPDPISGDLDNDRDVDSQDLTLFLANWTGTLDFGTGGKDKSTGDLDGDGDVDSNDILEFLSAWTGSQDADRQPQITPLFLEDNSEMESTPPLLGDHNDSGAYAQRIDEVFEQLVHPFFG